MTGKPQSGNKTRWAVLKALIERDDWMTVVEVDHACTGITVHTSAVGQCLKALRERGECEAMDSPTHQGRCLYRALQP